VVARKTVRAEGRDRVLRGECPGNPVRVPGKGGTARADVAMADVSGGGFAPRAGTGVTGLVTSGGRPVAGAWVFAYPAEGKTVRGPSFAAFARTDRQGRFRLLLREGAFLLAARRKGGESEVGAMRPGGESGGEAGRLVVLSPGEVKDAGVFLLHPAQETKRGRRAAAGGLEEGAAELRGVVLREDGAPAPGVVVMAYRDPRMIGRPFAVSGRTGSDGAFVLRLPVAGRFFLGARSEMGGPVSPGEWVGRYEGTPDHAVAAAAGERKTGIVIRVVEKW